MRIPRPAKLRHAISATIRPSQINVTEVEQVLRAYGLGELKSDSQPAIGSSRSRNLILETTEGKKVLKRYKYSLGVEAIIYEHSVLNHLANAGFTAPRLVLNREGKTYTQLEGRLYAVTDFVAGFKYSDFIISRHTRKCFVEQAARALARYHQLIDGLVPGGEKNDGFKPDGQERWHEYDWYLQEFAKYETLLKDRAPDAPELERFFRHNVDRLKQDLFELDQKLAHAGWLTKLVIHGDYGPYNLLFDQGKLSAVLDFECVHLDWRAGEVISAIHRFAGSKNGINYEWARTFFSAYLSRCSLADDEIALMPDIFRYFWLRAVPLALRDYFELAAPARIRGARHMVCRADWMKEHTKRLIDFLLSCKVAQF